MNQELILRVQRILVNIAYLLGEKLSWVAEKILLLKEIIHSFIEGFVNGTVANVQ